MSSSCKTNVFSKHKNLLGRKRPSGWRHLTTHDVIRIAFSVFILILSLSSSHHISDIGWGILSVPHCLLSFIIFSVSEYYSDCVLDCLILLYPYLRLCGLNYITLSTCFLVLYFFSLSKYSCYSCVSYVVLSTCHV
jgi:hypothetical protein